MTDSQKLEPQPAKTSVWKFVAPLAIFALLGGFLFVGLYRDPSYVPSPLIGKPAPQFSLPSVQDPSYPVASKELLGQPWVLNVWGTWCGGCREEHETLLAIAKQNAVPLIGLNWKDDNSAAQEWLRTLGNPYAAVAEDKEGRVAIDWGVYGAPETFLISADGKVLFKHIAPMTMDVWTKEFLPRIEAARASRTAQASG
jgi:cytochrome c biogenesis protein CcmG/thiol:disulfide interchange protein DsbE